MDSSDHPSSLREEILTNSAVSLDAQRVKSGLNFDSEYRRNKMYGERTQTCREYVKRVLMKTNLVLLFFFLLCTSGSLEFLDPRGNFLPPLFQGEPVHLVFETFCLPICCFFRGFEGRVFSDCCMSIRVNLLDVIRANSILEIT